MLDLVLVIFVIINFSSKSKDDKVNKNVFFGYKE